MSEFRIESAILCDDIRREDNGKLLLIGVYGKNIGLLQLPATLVLHVLLIATVGEPGTYRTEFQVLLNSNKLTQGKGNIVVSDAGRNLINVSPLILHEIKEEGMLRFEVRIDDGNWMNLIELPLTTEQRVQE